MGCLTEQMLQYMRASGYDLSVVEQPNGLIECFATHVGGGSQLVARCGDGWPSDRKHRAVRRLLHLVAADARQRLAA